MEMGLNPGRSQHVYGMSAAPSCGFIFFSKVTSQFDCF